FPEWGFVGEEGEGATPAPSVPAPSVPAPSVPAPSVPAPSVPAPSVPAPSSPAPTTPGASAAPSAPATSPAPIGRRLDRPTWVVDPLDGTTNFVHGLKRVAVAIALVHAGRTWVGCIYDPFQDHCYTARAGGGAFCNGQPLRVADVAHLRDSLLATGFAADTREHRPVNARAIEALIPRVRSVRALGAAALDLADVACGRLTGFWEFGLSPWDVLAGALLVQEAGGRVTAADGSAFDPAGGSIVATNGLIHEELLDALRPLTAAGR
ncbi:MAG: hypothetical protein IRY95_06895, partial [Clostridia bacterium]|nr:hypothetical protein [Clostridia bacterium]